ncbi:MAG: class I SAM-dependent methyltransferase [Candidatus Nanohaloarchaea archaeon]|nr:class I SAM-dependent methyltransferase [Candidatus Nanohaloarchaea archaeon]
MSERYGETGTGLYDLERTAARLQDGEVWGDWRVGNTARNRYFGREMHLGPVLRRAIDRGDTVVDLGCSRGATTYDLAERYAAEDIDVYGVDAAGRAGTAGRDRSDAADFLQGLCPGLPFDTGSIDTVIAANSVHIAAQQFRKLERSDFIGDALSDLGRVTAPDGDLLLAEADGLSYLHLERVGGGPAWDAASIRGYEEQSTGRGVMLPTSLLPWIEHDDVGVDERATDVYAWDGHQEVPAESHPTGHL